MHPNFPGIWLVIFQDVYSKTYLIETADDLIVAKPIAAKETPGINLIKNTLYINL